MKPEIIFKRAISELTRGLTDIELLALHEALDGDRDDDFFALLSEECAKRFPNEFTTGDVEEKPKPFGMEHLTPDENPREKPIYHTCAMTHTSGHDVA